MFLELKTSAGEFSAPAAGNDDHDADDDDDDDDDDDENSRMSSVTDETASRDEGHSAADIQVTGIGPKVRERKTGLTESFFF